MGSLYRLRFDNLMQDIDITTASVERHESLLSQHDTLLLLKKTSICPRDNSEVAIDALSDDGHKS